MNTPNLISILSSSAVNTDPARSNKATDPARGLDFSQLLGERRSQNASASDHRASRNDASRSTGKSGTADHGKSPRTAPVARNTDGAGRSTQAPSPRSSESAHSSSEKGMNDTSAPDTRQEASASNGSAGNAGRSTDDPATQTADAGSRATPAGEELAQGAAETGLPLAASPAASVLLPVSMLQEDGAGVRAAAAVNMPAAVQGSTLPEQGAADLLAGFAATVWPDLDAANDGPDISGATPLGARPQGLSPASPMTAAPPPALLLSTVGELPALAAVSAQVAPSGETASATLLPATLAPLPIDPADSAAARSLQDFTAMVEAARATAGTAMPPSTQLLQVSTTAAAVPGLLPVQPPVPVSPAAPGIAATLGSPQWPTEFGRQFISIAKAGNGLGQVAELRLDPPELGPLRITINLNDNVAQAVFSSPHAAVRQSVENALPQLQQMLEQAGISLGQANVNDQHQPGSAFGENTGDGRQANTGDGSDAALLAAEGNNGRNPRPADPNALVDTFA